MMPLLGPCHHLHQMLDVEILLHQTLDTILSGCDDCDFIGRAREHAADKSVPSE